MLVLLLVGITAVVCSAKPQGNQAEQSCTDFADQGFNCVNYYQCNDQQKIITDGKGLIDPRQDGDDCVDLEAAAASSCPKLLQVCCQLPGFTSTPCQDDNDYYGDDNGYDTPEEPRQGDEDYVEDEVFGGLGGGGTPTLPPSQTGCGLRTTGGVDDVRGSDDGLQNPAVKDANYGEWPHVCAVIKEEYVGTEGPIPIYRCGGSLIDDGVILTAGHCVNDTKSLEGQLVVRCGEWDTQNENERLPYQQIRVKEITIHPDFNVDNHHNNFALLFMEEDFTRQEHINPICLPKPCSVIGDDQICVSHGWGKDKFGSEGSFSTILKEVVLPIVDNGKCQNLLRSNTRLGYYFELDDSFICAGGDKDIDTCKGDGGSPLACRQGREGPWFQSGIVSWGIGCGEDATPAVYAGVAQAACWIDQEVSTYFGESDSHFGFDKEECATISCEQK